MIYKSDLFWLLATPIYILIGTFRHEVSHAVMAVLEGASIEKFVFWPTWHKTSGLYWGYVTWIGYTSWLTIAAPYFIDLATFALFFWITLLIPFKHRWLWLNLVIIGIVSPIVNSTYNYLGVWRNSNDISQLATHIAPKIIHLYFIGTITLYIVGLFAVFKHSRTNRAL